MSFVLWWRASTDNGGSPGNDIVTRRDHGGRMVTPTSDRTGILIVRIWIEPSAAEGFRARVVHSPDSGEGEATTASAGSHEALYAIVRAWAEAFTDAN